MAGSSGTAGVANRKLPPVSGQGGVSIFRRRCATGKNEGGMSAAFPAPCGSNELQAGHVLAVDEADGAVLFVEDDEVVDGGLLEDVKGLDGEGALADGFRGGGHVAADRLTEDLFALEGGAAEIAVAEDAGQPAGFRVAQGDGTAPGPGDGEKGLLDGDGIGGCGEAPAGAHDFLDAQQEGLAEAAGGMVLREVVAGEAAQLEVDHGEGVAHGEGGGGGSGGGEVQRAGFALVVIKQDVVAESAKGALGVAGEGDGGEPEPFETGKEAEEVLGLAAVADEQAEIALAAEPEVAVQGLVGIEEGGGNGGGIEGPGQLEADGDVFADAGEDEFLAGVAGGLEKADRLDEALVEPLLVEREGVLLDAQAFAGGGEDGVVGEGHGIKFSKAVIAVPLAGTFSVVADGKREKREKRRHPPRPWHNRTSRALAADGLRAGRGAAQGDRRTGLPAGEKPPSRRTEGRGPASLPFGGAGAARRGGIASRSGPAVPRPPR